MDVHKLIINQLGPIEKCELECSQFMALTGFQASGKSTIAKAIFFFRTIKDDIVELAKSQALKNRSVNELKDEFGAEGNIGLKKMVENHLRDKFLRTFGSSWGMPIGMYLEYYFTESCHIKISLVEEQRYDTPNYIWIDLGDEVKTFLRKKDNCLTATPMGIVEEEIEQFKAELCRMFADNCSVVYIPAGRSMITLLSQQVSYLYATMDDVQKRSLDSCTKDYLERILRLKSEFSEGLKGLMAYSANRVNASREEITQALNLIKQILRGSYRYNNGEEQIVLDDGKYVKINYSSSGQQECVWILNLLFYYLLQQKQFLFIIEEPESHLFPESQKYITELIALVGNCGHSVVVTTHSPYVLGTLNNLLYAPTVSQEHLRDASAIIPKCLWIDEKKFDSWFVKNGMVENCMDSEIHMIQNERIDEISKVINKEFDMLLELKDVSEEGE